MAALVVLCAAVVEGFPLAQEEYAQQLGDAAPVAGGQQAWAQAVNNYHPAPNQWAQAVSQASPSQLNAALTGTASRPQLPNGDPVTAQKPAPKESLSSATKALQGYEEKQVRTARLQTQLDHQQEEKMEAKIAGLKIVDKESRTMDQVELQNKENTYERAENQLEKDKKRVQKDDVNSIGAKMMVGVPSVHMHKQAAKAPPTHFFYPGVTGQPGMN